MSESAPIEHPTWLTTGDFTEADEPLRLFAAWFEEAVRGEPRDPTAMSLATVDADGRPNVRMVLMKGFDERGFVFYTNLESRKAQEIAANPHVSLLFPWQDLQRQVRVEGPASPVSAEENEAYFASRPRESQLGAWASPQSRVVASRSALDERYGGVLAQFAEVDAVPLPPFWGGLRVEPETVEFWQGRKGRMHDRLVYRRDAADPSAPWTVDRLAP